jgi:hypothetical protein
MKPITSAPKKPSTPIGFHIKAAEDRPIPKDIFPNAISIIEYSFSIGNNDYFAFSDFNQTPMDRAFNALSFFTELDMRCTREYLQAHCTAVDNMINDTKSIKLTEIVKLNMQLKERLDFLFEPEIAYKLCSVVFFDETENPNRYEYKKGLEKARLFREVPISDFFLSKPIGRFVPATILSTNDFQESCEVLTKITKKHLSNISTMLSESDKKNDWFKRLELLIQEESASKTSENLVSTITT